jgi:hypothetical protein
MNYRGEGFRQIVHSANLHGHQAAIHVDAARHHQKCPVTVRLQGTMQQLPPLQGLSALTHQHEREVIWNFLAYKYELIPSA